MASPLHLLFGAFKSKDAAGVLKPFAGIADAVHTVPITDHECRDRASWRPWHGPGLQGLFPRKPSGQALAAIRKPVRALVFGSLYLAGDALAANDYVPD